MRRHSGAFALFAFGVAALLVFGVVGAPTFTDAYYHFNAASRAARGDGLTDAYVWTYIGATGSLPMPSHLYWMPMTSALSATSMIIFNAPGSYAAAQVPLALMFWGAALIAFHLGRKLGGTARHAWVAGLLMLFSPFFARFWGATDTFAPYAFWGAACLVVTGAAVERPRAWRWALAGALAACGHLTRADGLILVGAAGLFALLRPASLPRRVYFGALVAIGYMVVMAPFAARNLAVIGAPLPLGGAQAAWFREYNDLFNYPPIASPERLLADGFDVALAGRAEALANNLGTLIAVEGLIVLTPVMLIGGWARRRDPALAPFWLFALLTHVTMTLIFPFPGYRGGLFHSAAALMPFWSALAVIGIDACVDWAARRRRRWRSAPAKWVFSGASVALALLLTLNYVRAGRAVAVSEAPPLYAALKEALPADARVFFDDVPALYYYTALGDGVGLGGATLPNDGWEAFALAAEAYDIGYVAFKTDLAALPAAYHRFVDAPPAFLQPIPLNSDEVRLYAIRRE